MSSLRNVAAAVTSAALLLLLATPQAGAGGGRSETVGVDNFDFGPATVRIAKGERVRWINGEGAHTVTFGNGFNELLTDEGDSASRRFRKPGTYRYLCTFHDDQGMTGKVIVKG